MPSTGAIIGGIIAIIVVVVSIVLGVYYGKVACPDFGSECETLVAGSPSPVAGSPTTPSTAGMITGKIVKIARTDNRNENINLLGIDVYDGSGAKITTGITPSLAPVYLGNSTHYGPQFLIDGVHAKWTDDGFERLPHTEAVSTAYMQLDLGADKTISKIVIYNRTDCCMDRINGCTLTVDNSAGSTVLAIPLSGAKAVYTFGTPLTNASTSSTYVPEPYNIF